MIITSNFEVQSVKKLKVLSITHGGIQHSAGRQRYAELFNNSSIDLTLVVPNKWHDYKKIITPDPPAPGTKVRIEKIRLRHFPKVEWYLHYYPKLKEILLEVNPDIIHLWEEPWALVSLQAAYLRNKYLPKAALILETDQNISRRLPFPFQQIRKYMLKQTDLLIGRNDEALNVSRNWGFTGPASIVEYGIERNNFTPFGTKEARIKFDTKHFTIGYVGRIVSYKGLNDILDAMTKTNYKIYLNVLGNGPDEDAFLIRVKELNLSDQVKMFGSRPANEVATFIKSLDALILMSKTTKTWKEQFGRVIMEAQACGIPVIGSDSGSIPSVVNNGGWIVEEGNVDKLAQLLDQLYVNPDMLKTASIEGLMQADTRFSFDVISRELASAYFKAADARNVTMQSN